MKNISLILAVILLSVIVILNCKANNKNIEIQSITISEINQIIFSATDKGLSISYDDGNSWENHSSFLKDKSYDKIINVYFYNNRIFCGLESGLIISTDMGSTWKIFDNYRSPTSSRINEIFVYKDIIYLATSNGLIISYDYGNTWDEKNHIIKAIDDDSTVFVYNDIIYFGSGWRFYIKDFYGKTIKRYEMETEFRCETLSSTVNDIFVKDGIIYLGRSCGLQISTDQGESWTLYNKENCNYFGYPSYDVYVDKDNIIYSTNLNGISISNDNGQTWKNYPIISDTKSSSVNNFHVIDRSNIYVATDEGLKVTHDGGETWETYEAKDGLCSDNIYDVFVYTD